MKAALNGGLNLSILDGWWDEWYDGENGWAIPSADGVEDPDRRDDLEAAALYDLIENEVAPRFYDRRRRRACRTRWIEMVRHTLKSLGPKVLATRMVRDYVDAALHARPPAPARALNGRRTPAPRELAAWKTEVRAGLAERARRPRRVLAASATPRRSATTLHVRAFVSLGGLTPDDVDGRRSCTAASTTTTSCVDVDGRRRSTLAESYEGGRHRFDGDLRARAAPARSATPCGCCPSTPAWPAPPSSGLVANA